MRERYLVTVGVRTIDVVKADGHLGDHLQMSFAGFEDLGVNLVAQGGYQPVDARLYFFDDQGLGRSFRLGVNL